MLREERIWVPLLISLAVAVLVVFPSLKSSTASAARSEESMDQGLRQSRRIPARDYWEAAQRSFASGEFAETLRLLARFRPANDDAKGEAAYLHLRGASYLMLGKVNQARNDLERAVQLDNSQPGYYLDLVLACLKSGDHTRANTIATLGRQRFQHNIKLQVEMASLFEPRWEPAPWRLEGKGVIACPCRTPCPCRSNAPPTGPRCEALGVMQIESGYWGKTSLNRLRFAIPGCMSNPFRFLPVLYVDSNSSEAEQKALQQILRDFNDQHSMVFVVIKRVPISFRRQGDLLAAASPGLFCLKVKFPAAGSDQVRQTAALDYFSNTIQYVKNLVYWFRDPELGSTASWNFSGRQANYRVISVNSEDYRRKRMLIQWADESGSFNKQQLELIHELHLPVASYH